MAITTLDPSGLLRCGGTGAKDVGRLGSERLEGLTVMIATAFKPWLWGMNRPEP